MASSDLSRRAFIGGAAAVAGVAATGGLAACSSATPRPTSALDALAASLQGSLLRPDMSAFAEVNLPKNDAYESVTPLAIAQCATPDDVVICVKWCVSEGVQPVVRGGGHNYIGASTTTGLLISTGAMNSVEYDAAKGTVTLGSGALNANLLDTLRGGEWMLPIGTCPGVGVTGLVLGGGIGDNARWAGMTCDHLESTDIVLANGELVTASERENADLFWALRGGAGGNFGVNTRLTFRLVRIPKPTITVFGLRFFGRDNMVAAWSAFDRLMLEAPRELSGFTGVTNVRPIGGNNSPVGSFSTGYPVLTIDGCYQGSPEEAREVLAPVFAAAEHDDVVIGEFDYWSAQINWLAVPYMTKHGLAEAARFTREPIPTDVLDQLIDRVLNAPGGTEDASAEVRLMCWSGGVVNDVPSDAMAYVHRSSNNLLRPAILWRDQPQAMIDDLQDWQRETFAYASQFTEQGSFVNWPYADLENWGRAYYGANLERLVDVKRAVDPDDVFTYAQGIPTSLA
jgi:FAD/FMN-containing dehydrogenase